MLNLKSFKISGMNGESDININFHDNKKILIAENGSGKTTVMSIMYYALKNDINGLKKYNFDECAIKFEGRPSIIFKKSDLEDSEFYHNIDQPNRKIPYVTIRKNLKLFDSLGMLFFKRFGTSSFELFIYEYFTHILSQKNTKQRLSNNEKNMFLYSNNKNFILSYFEKSEFQNINFFYDYIDDLASIRKEHLESIYLMLDKEFFLKKDDIFNRESFSLTSELLLKILGYIFTEDNRSISNKQTLGQLDKRLMFLPTYRRIEHDSIELLSGEYSLKKDSVLSFGMGDVQNLFKKISEKIISSTERKISEIKNNALNDFIAGHDAPYQNLITKKISREYFAKVLQRIGSSISHDNQKKLLSILEEGSTNPYLLNLIHKICDIYNKQILLEQDIKKYIDTCNKYLFKKKLIYNENKLAIEVIKESKKNKEILSIHLTNLSSGEKQIISLFAKLYLSHIPDLDLDKTDLKQIKGYWILFDEPELSLSVDWQEMLLPDILESGRCEFLFVTTHSPFIFNNDLRFYTSHITECIEERV